MLNKKIMVPSIIILILLALAAVWVLQRPASSLDGQSATTQPSEELLKQGEYIARLGDCVACHSVPHQAPFTGGLAMQTPIGKIYTTNITPDPQTGIGRYTLADFDRAVRHGVAQDGHRLYPAMPYPSYQKMSDDDIRALYAFMMHSVKPVSHQNTPSSIPWPLNMRWPLAFWSAAFVHAGPYQPVATENDQWNRGAYLVEGLGHCGSCHTPRGLAFNEKGLSATSEDYLAGAELDGWFAPSLRNDANTGISRWSEQEVYDFLKQGRNRHSVVFGSMTEVYNNSTQFFTDSDLHAISYYLKSLPAGSHNAGPVWHYPHDVAAAQQNGSPSAGEQIYATRCASCHQPDGRGQAPWIPPLAGTTSMLNEGVSSTNIVLNGSARVVSNGVPDAYRMPAFRALLSDQEIKQVLDFVRSNWGNNGAPVTEKDIHALREKTEPASSESERLRMY